LVDELEPAALDERTAALATASAATRPAVSTADQCLPSIFNGKRAAYHQDDRSGADHEPRALPL
jgi:hypothetical protein